MDRGGLISVVVPCFNEADGIEALHERVTAVCRDRLDGWRYELVLVDDGSTDATWDKISQLTSTDDAVVGVALSRNHGHQLALSAGLTVCRGDRVLVLDADLQDPPELLPGMMELMDGGADVVYGKRVLRRGETVFKRTTAAAFYRLLSRLVDVHIPPDTGDFRLMSRRALDILIRMPERQRFIRGMVSWVGFNQVPIEYERDARFAGETKYTLRKMLGFALDAITSFSVRPLRLATYLGLGFGLLAAVAVIYALVGWMGGETVPGWTSVMIAVLGLGGVQLLVLGMMGEYLGRLYMESKQRPMFVIDRVVRRGATLAEKEPAPGYTELERRLLATGSQP